MSKQPYAPQKVTRLAAPCLALRPKDAARALGIGERKLWEITADHTSGIPHIRFGKAILYPVRELQDWLAARARAPIGA